jgi:ubiquinone/menaquinone biosynthesis C-methylase UbiE
VMSPVPDPHVEPTRAVRPGGFDRVARVYRWMEYLAFGAALQRARTAHLEALRECRTILVIGDGDGRCLEVLLRRAPQARVTSVDASARMLRLARRRAARAGGAGRVEFVHADVRQLRVEPGHYDAVLTMFVLDCFRADDVRALVAALAAGLKPGGLWLYVDFAMPARGWRHWHARLWVGFLYAFFRLTTGIDARALPPAEAGIEAAGLVPVAIRRDRAGLLSSVAFRRP